MPSLPEKSPPPGPLFFIEVRVLARLRRQNPIKKKMPSRVRILNTFWFIAGGRGGVGSTACFAMEHDATARPTSILPAH